ncbi:MAG: DUF3501 family protein [Myxococcota bacterium]
MSALAASDLLDRARYERVRDAYRARVIAHKRDRRVAVGELVSLVFEDRETVRYQILEMARVERIDDPAKLAHEIEVYGELLPTSHELAATLFIEIPEMGRIRSELDRLLGIDAHVALVVGRGDGAARVRARFDERQMEADRISAVHYLRFPLDDGARARFLASDDAEPARLVIDHPAYAFETELAGGVRESLRRDLRGETPSLLDPSSVPAGAPTAPVRVLEEDALVRVVEPALRRRVVHLRVEPRAAVASLADCEPAVAAALFEKARGIAGSLAARGVAARVVGVFPAADGRAAPADAGAALEVVSLEASTDA